MRRCADCGFQVEAADIVRRKLKAFSVILCKTCAYTPAPDYHRCQLPAVTHKRRVTRA